ncbi:YggS family pyridoxal phosphate enzyme [Campylobacter sputorum subsp. bubulus]|uniref:Pyridoxal phosphate homeostasis protein n=1 Tax=Campylobacter sputorum subsp. sputorum TaxID=32024 RepID=A0A381DLE8_9BACT|nr:YggS family pyridoxal phosphate-dependent enzyme [Campylobacter sputorum]ASM34819.1 type III pyridoxal 5-phosphate (PLP)-dependent enzyme, YggS family [Campylobacter sputorum aubsp. sputorum RM3237]KAB0581625.1 YggS family pyridoxal phosphate-dependent enzyme [Campylobacter sputorum subsp. sputorum]QEL05012.1 type III pyridoxal 5-phosphate (PLP)-dependent enzyme, YggS family [Campylobacter sputorum subsp. sputorum]SUX10181.1 YggS family pyridoxal phosphate enzyme [Campylobacter sputorum subs
MNYQEILEKIQNTKDKFSQHNEIKLIAVSKYVTSNEIINLYNQGQIEFGENKVQDLNKKMSELQNYDIKWHFIGSLQSNKINQLISLRPTLWQSCNSLELAKKVDKRLDYKLDTLLEINVANEDTKSGIDTNKALEEYLQIQQECKNLNMCGVMSIGANSDDVNLVRKSFEDTYKIYEKLKSNGAKICSMGMSSDFELAIKCGSNMLRLGTILFKDMR